MRVAPDAGTPAPVTVATAVVGIGGTPTLVAAQQLVGATAQWRATVTMLANLVGQRVVVRIVDTLGNTSLTGTSDFALVP